MDKIRNENQENFLKKERREGDSNPRDAGHHGISNPAPYRAWLSRHIELYKRVS